MLEEIILVDESDRVIGTEEKLRAHQRGGRLHRAFSVFVFNSAGELMLQKRAAAKYHSGGLWTNTCCGHPRPAEGTEEAAHRRLREEMGFDTQLKEELAFVYRAELDHGLVEHEFLHIFTGTFDGEPAPDEEEAGDWRWSAPDELDRDLAENPDEYTEWFIITQPRLRSAV